MTRTWIAETVKLDKLADTLNRLEHAHPNFELHGIYPTGQLEPGAGGFADKQPGLLIVGASTPPKPAQFA